MYQCLRLERPFSKSYRCQTICRAQRLWECASLLSLSLEALPPARSASTNTASWTGRECSSSLSSSLSSTRVIRYPAIEDINTSQPRDHPPSVQPTLSIDRRAYSFLKRIGLDRCMSPLARRTYWLQGVQRGSENAKGKKPNSTPLMWV